MPRQSLILTALPNGFSRDGKLRLSVLVSPRLDPQAAPTTLKSFLDFRTWPTTIASAMFTVHLGAKKVALTSADFDGTIAAPDAATWTALFPDTTFVRPFSMRDHSADTAVSYDTTAMNDLVAGLYAKLAANATDELPTMTELLADLDITKIVDGVTAIDGKFWDKGTRGPDANGMLESLRESWKGIEGAAQLAAFQLFQTPPSKAAKQTVSRTDDRRITASWQSHNLATLDAAKAVAELDFHQIVAAMNQYPTLLRRLGLVLDFAIASTSLDTGADLPLSVTADIPAPKFEASDPVLRVVRHSASPVTHTRLSAKAFIPVSRPSPKTEDFQAEEGLLKLDDKHFALLQADVDGAGHKLMNFARTLGAHRPPTRQVDPVTKLPRHIAAPALRNAGLMLVQKRRGDLLRSTFMRNKTLDDAIKQMFVVPTAPVPSLYAEDLIRGYRVDIWDKNKNVWKSLCQRIANYEIAKGAVTLSGLQEEGTVRLGATSSMDGTNPDVLYLHEELTVWNGWSLVAQQPGQAVALHPELATTPAETVRSSAADVPEGIRLRTSFIATPGSLPRLRYGHVYGVRARIVDLAGNSLAPSPKNYSGDDASIAAASPYLRFEPVQPPTIALVSTGAKPEPNLPLEGESMTRVAVRTMNDRFDDPAPTAQIGLRWGVVPRVSQREAELHGVLDGPAWGTPAQHAMLVARDADLKHIDVKIDAASPGDTATPVKYAVLPARATELPYLPDPLCTHIIPRLRNYPYASLPEMIEIPLYPDGRTWPNAAPFFIQVEERAGAAPEWVEAKRTLFIPLPKGTRATLRLSAKLVPEALSLMGVWNWIPAAQRTPALARAAGRGALWPLTPWREIEVVHAVQRPLLSPEINAVHVERVLAGTSVNPGVDAACHCATTDRVDLHAAWHDPHDAPAGASPHDDAKTDVPFGIKIIDPLGYAGVVEHLFPDPANPNRIVFGPNTLSKEKQLNLINKVHDFGDTRYRRVEYHLVATSRFREYMPKDEAVAGLPRTTPWTEAKLSVAGAPKATWALSSAPPPAPEVLYVVPTFGWTRTTDASGKQTSRRTGHGLRVWLARPWNATGYGEMLGVILPQMNSTVDPNDPPYKNTVTQWGNDPIWKAPFVPGVAPDVNAFPRARTAPDPTGAWLPPGAPDSEKLQPVEHFTTRSMPHAGLPRDATTGFVDVAPHDVFWDGERRLWYCDIEFPATAAYFPFIRMALARYQPSSLDKCHLSNVVLADFASLAPNRSLSVTRTSATRRQVQVSGFTHEESSGFRESEDWRKAQIPIVAHVPSGISKTNVIDVWVEKLTVAQGEDFGWHRVDDTDGFTAARPPVVAAKPPIVAAKPPVVAAKPPVVAAKPPVVAAKPAVVAKPIFAKAAVVAKGAKADVTAEPANPPVAEYPALWSGTIDLPSAPSPSARFRLVVAEYEEYLADDSTPYNARPDKKTRRLVFVEHVELT